MGMMAIHELDRHLERFQPLAVRLRRGGRANPEIVGILLVEAYFRSELRRLMELVMWPVLWLIWPARLARLSVGPGQIQLRHWRRETGWRSLAPGWQRFCTVVSWEANYDMVSTLTMHAKGLHQRGALHLGQARGYYLACLRHTVSWLDRTSRQLPPGSATVGVPRQDTASVLRP